MDDFTEYGEKFITIVMSQYGFKPDAIENGELVETKEVTNDKDILIYDEFWRKKVVDDE